MKFYCLSFNNPERRRIMEQKFQQLNLDYEIYEGVSFEDPRLKTAPEHAKRVWSCMYGHMDMINKFYLSGAPHAIFCEDDILIHKDLPDKLEKITENFQSLNLNVLLLGYLSPVKITIGEKIPGYYEYHNELWGTQMYMLSRDSAHFLIKQYDENYAKLTQKYSDMTPFAADWTITKYGKRALISPIMCIENGKGEYEDEVQRIFHQKCYEAHVNDKFI